MAAGFANVAIIGLGLIGGSIAAALQKQGVVVSAYDANADSLQQGITKGIINVAAPSISALAVGADLIIVAVPVLAVADVMAELVPYFDNPKVVITDVGSVKCSIVEVVQQIVSQQIVEPQPSTFPVNFVPGHPIAGSEKHGVSASNPNLFDKHKVILTPLESTNEVAVERLISFWQNLGADVTRMDVHHHDEILAQTSHLPHLLAYALIDTLSLQGDSLEIFDFAAGGLRDFSRIAASDPTMWRDIFKSNRKPLVEILERYMSDLSNLKSMIEEDNLEDLFELLERAKAARDHFTKVLESRQ